jgi:hypothetical protein
MKFKNYIETESGIKDTSASPGTAGQLLSSTVAGTSWIDQNTISSGTSETIDIQVKNIASADGGIDLVKGDPVYIYGSVGASPRLYIDLADADSTATNNLGDSKMPCVALLDQDLSPNGEGTATVVGKLRNLITNPIDGNVPNENDTVYVKSGGGLTLTKPAGSTNLIQNVGQVGRVSTSADGNIVVAALLRTNDVPNLPEGRLFVGTSANTSLVSDVVYVDDTNDRVGIGTTNPNAKLEVVGTTGVIIDSGSSNAAKLTLIGDGSSYGGGGTIDIIGGAVDYMSYNLNLKRSPNTLEAFNRYWQGNVKWEWDGNIGGTVAQPYTSYEFKTQGSSQMVIWNNNVGIGTTSPGEKLTVAGNISVTSPNSFLVKNGDSNHGLKYGYNTFASNPTDGPILYGYDAGGLGTKRSSENIALYWNYLGNVGIGTTSPSSQLSSSRVLDISSTGNSEVILDHTDAGATSDLGLYSWNRNNDHLAHVKASCDGATDSAFISFHAQATGGSFSGPGSNEKMRIKSNGNVGINTTDPKTKLHVASANGSDTPTAGTATGGLFVSNTNKTYGINMGVSGGGWSFIQGQRADGNTTLYNLNLQPLGGNVGIGTTSPSELLHLRSTGPARLLIEADSDNVTETDNAQIILKQDGGAVVGRLGYRTNTNDLELLNEYSSNIYLGTSNSIRATLHANGNFGIGNSTPQAKLHVSNGLLRTWSPSSGTSAIFESTVSNRNFVTLTAANEAELWFGNASTQTLGRIRYEMAGNNMEFWTNATQKMVINSSGSVGIGTTSPNSKLHVSGTVSHSTPLANFDGSVGPNVYGAVSVRVDNINYGTAMKFYRSLSADNNAIGFQNGASTVGSITIGTSSTAYNTTSDYRLKENLTAITDGIDRLKQLKPRRFNFIGNADVVDGFIAHEAKEVIPESVTGEKDEVLPNGYPVYQGIDQSKIVPLLTAALQEAVSKIEQLETRIQKLENK